MRRHGDYGYDAPYVLIAFAIAAAVSASGALVVWRDTGAMPTPLVSVQKNPEVSSSRSR